MWHFLSRKHLLQPLASRDKILLLSALLAKIQMVNSCMYSSEKFPNFFVTVEDSKSSSSMQTNCKQASVSMFDSSGYHTCKTTSGMVQ